MTDLMQVDSVDLQVNLETILQPSQPTSTVAATLKTLADRSGHDLNVRRALARDDILKVLIARLNPLSLSNKDQELQRQILRCVGNACAMNPDAVRAICGIDLLWLQNYISLPPHELQSDLRQTIVGVLYNLLAADFTEEDTQAENPALEACYQSGVHIWLIRLIAERSSTGLGDEELIDMLFWLSSCAADHEDETLPDESITQAFVMLGHIQELPAEPLCTCVEAVVALLRPRATRVVLAERFDIAPLYSLLELLEHRIATAKADAEPSSKEDLTVLTPQSSNLTWLLSDVSAEPSFAKETHGSEQLFQSCVLHLGSSSSSDQMFIASCLIVGNALLNLEDAMSITLIERGVASGVVRRCASQETTPDVLYSATGLLTNLCRPKSSREALGVTPGLIQLVTRVCSSKAPQISQAGLRLVRSLGRECPANQVRLASVLEALPQAAIKP